MNVYVEPNFVLELAFVQGQCSACEEVLILAERHCVELFVPAYSLCEPHETLHRRRRERLNLQEELHRGLSQTTSACLRKTASFCLPLWHICQVVIQGRAVSSTRTARTSTTLRWWSC